MPHLGIYASDPFKGRSRRGLLGDVMEEIDDSVGRVLTAINEGGIAKNTLIFFSSDNGPWLLFKNTESQLKDDYGFKASRETPLLFQVEQDLGERIDRASEHPAIVSDMLRALDEQETQIAQEGSFWDKR